jgi:hypothetical protein
MMWMRFGGPGYPNCFSSWGGLVEPVLKTVLYLLKPPCIPQKPINPSYPHLRAYITILTLGSYSPIKTNPVMVKNSRNLSA